MGGNRNRKQGKKHQMPANRNIRTAAEDGEMYAKFTKLFGGSNAEVLCSDGVTRRCIIRSKFRGRHRRDNRVEPGVLCLVGKRLWESARTSSTVDLLHVYSAEHRGRVRKEINVSWDWLDDEPGQTVQSSIAFADEIPGEEEAALDQELVSNTAQLDIEEAIDVADI